MATKNSKNKAGKNHILKNPVVIVLAFIAMTALILASSFYAAQKNKVDITQIVLNGNIQLAVGENQAVGFNVATPKVMDNDLVVNAVNKLDLVWTVEDEMPPEPSRLKIPLNKNSSRARSVKTPLPVSWKRRTRKSMS